MSYSNPKILGFLITRLSRRSTGAGLFFLEVYVFVTSICFTWSPYDLFRVTDGSLKVKARCTSTHGNTTRCPWSSGSVGRLTRRRCCPEVKCPCGWEAGPYRAGRPISTLNKQCQQNGSGLATVFVWRQDTYRIYVSLLDHHLVSHSSLVVNLLFSSALKPPVNGCKCLVYTHEFSRVSSFCPVYIGLNMHFLDELSVCQSFWGTSFI
jgi:hypothetical protein